MCFARSAMSRSSLIMSAWSAGSMTARKLSLKVSKKAGKESGRKSLLSFLLAFSQESKYNQTI
jgi:hypothetical protein